MVHASGRVSACGGGTSGAGSGFSITTTRTTIENYFTREKVYYRGENLARG